MGAFGLVHRRSHEAAPALLRLKGVGSTAGGSGMARRLLLLLSMKYLKRIIVVTSLISMVGACYVEQRGPRYAHRGCAYGWYWDGYHCHRSHRW